LYEFYQVIKGALEEEKKYIKLCVANFLVWIFLYT